MSRPNSGSKYQRLADHLAVQPGDAVALSFTHIEAILRRPLPSSALLPTWWRDIAARYLAAVGWAVWALDRWGSTVTFMRVSGEPSRAEMIALARRPGRRRRRAV